METKYDLGIDVYGVFNVLIPKNTKIPFEKKMKLIPSEKYKDFRLYEGLYKNINKNYLIHVFNIEKNNMEDITLILNDKNELKINAGTYESEFIKRKEFIKEEYDTQEDDIWFKTEQQRIIYMEYVLSIKDTLQDTYIIEKINKLNNTYYDKIVKKINRAEMICFIEGVTCEEFKMATKEIEDFIDPIFKSIVLKNEGEIIV